MADLALAEVDVLLGSGGQLACELNLDEHLARTPRDAVGGLDRA